MALLETAHRYRWAALALASAAQLSNALGTQSAGPLAPLFQPELALSKFEVGIFSSAIYAGSWGVLLAAGLMADRFGVRPMLTLGEFILAGGLLSMIFTDSFRGAIIVMFVAGIGSGTVLPAGGKAVMDWFPMRERAMAMGIKQSAAPFAGVLTASVLPALALAFGWRGALAAAGLLVLCCAFATPVTYREAQRNGGNGEASISVRMALRRVLANRRAWMSALIAVLFVVTQVAVQTYLALFLEDTVLVPAIPDQPTRILVAGGYLALCQFSGAFGRVFWGTLSDRVFAGNRTGVLLLVGILAGMASVAFAYVTPGYPLWLLTILVLAVGITAIGWNGVQHTMMVESVGAKYAATAVGLSLTVNQFGTIGGPPLFGFAVDISGSYRVGWFAMGAFSLAGALVALIALGEEKRLA